MRAEGPAGLSSVQERRAVTVHGIVQGVGFRPFVYSLARRYGLTGWVRNDAAGVEIEVAGAPAALDQFLQGLEREAPPLALIESIAWQPRPAQEEKGFRIQASQDGTEHHALISPDMAACDACLKELFDPTDRRYRYPFINCTHCGPRFTITRAVPYDRVRTTMAGFPMCAACRREYDDPADRRFHAQPNACPACGPAVRLFDRSGRVLPLDRLDPIAQAARLLRQGAVLAVKGLGGYHLACDPFNNEAVGTLRRRKVRPDKPFAVMAADLAQVRPFCQVRPSEEALLTSPARPIVLLPQHTSTESLSPGVAPRQETLGVMLAYTPLHHLLLHDAGIPVVMTSGNRSEEPIAYRDAEAFEQLGEIADYFLVHNRPIHMRCDDSVVRVTGSGHAAKPGAVVGIGSRKYPPPTTHYPLIFHRRARGYAPAPLAVRERFRQHTLACGGELKNTFCLAKEQHVFLSHHIGDLENYETWRSFQEGIEHYCRLFDVRPELVAYDLHPKYLSTKYARELEQAGIAAVSVQHHHAHIASCLADNERPAEERVIGVALDGTGFGADGAIWGGEFLEGSLADGFARRGHLEYLPLPGGEAAVRQPWRLAIAWLITRYGEEELLKLPLTIVRHAGERSIRQIARLLEHRLNTPLTSSAGRLFDAVAALVGVEGSWQVTYEGQAAVELELAASLRTHSTPAAWAQPYPFDLRSDTEAPAFILQTGGILAGVVEDLLSEQPAPVISCRFHHTMAELVAAGCERLRRAGGPASVALSGGVFQNIRLLRQVEERLRQQGLTVYRHRRVPPNDGGLCLGQAVLADRAVGLHSSGAA